MNWGDWSTVSDVWVFASPKMKPNTAVFENWDRLFVKRVLAVSGTRSHVGAVQLEERPKRPLQKVEVKFQNQWQKVVKHYNC